MPGLRVCPEPGCPNFRPCPTHAPISSRNHRGVSRHARGLGSEHDRNRAAIRALRIPCELRLDGCTGIATSPEHRIPRSRGGTNDPANIGAACLACQRRQGAALARAAR